MNIRSEVINIFNVLAGPSEVFENVIANPRCRAPVLFTLASSLIVGFFMIPVAEQPLRAIFTHNFGGDGAAAAVSSTVRFYLAAGMLVQTVMVFIRWAVFSFALYIIVRSLDPLSDIHGKQVFALVAYSEIIFIMMSVLTVLILYLQGLEKIESSSDMVVFKSVDVLFDVRKSNDYLASLLANINIFSLWYVVLISIGVKVLAGLKILEAGAVTGISWLCWSFVSLLEKPISEFVQRII